MGVRVRYGGQNASLGSGGSRLLAVMEERGVSRRRLAKMTGLDCRTVSGICSGKREGNMATWRAIARALGCSLDDIVGA